MPQDRELTWLQSRRRGCRFHLACLRLVAWLLLACAVPDVAPERGEAQDESADSKKRYAPGSATSAGSSIVEVMAGDETALEVGRFGTDAEGYEAMLGRAEVAETGVGDRGLPGNR